MAEFFVDEIVVCQKKSLNNAKNKAASFVGSHKAIIVLALCLALLVLLNVGPLAYVAANRKIPVYCVDRTDGKVALTFDAAWGADKTEQIMDICDQFGVKVTFFLVGFWSEKYPELVKQIFDRGHCIGTHSETHPKMGNMSAEQICEELLSSIKKITDNVSDCQVKLFRPPFGDYSNTLIETVSGLDLLTIQWSVDSLDWKGISGKAIAERVLKAKSGDIILCHNNSEHIVEALPVIFRGLLDKKLKPCRVDEIVYFENYYIDHSGRQILNKSDAL